MRTRQRTLETALQRFSLTSSRCASGSPASSRPAITMPLGSSSRKPASVTFWVAARSGAIRAPRLTKAGSAGAAGGRAAGRGGSTLSLTSSSSGQIGSIRRLGWFWCDGRDLRAERDTWWNSGLHLAAEGGGEHGALCDQLGFGLLDQLVLVDLEEVDAEQRQREHAGEHDKDDEAEARSPFSAGVDRGLHQRCASQRPSLKPTPCTVSIADLAAGVGKLGADVADMAVDGAVGDVDVAGHRPPPSAARGRRRNPAAPAARSGWRIRAPVSATGASPNCTACRVRIEREPAMAQRLLAAAPAIPRALAGWR